MFKTSSFELPIELMTTKTYYRSTLLNDTLKWPEWNKWWTTQFDNQNLFHSTTQFTDLRDFMSQGSWWVSTFLRYIDSPPDIWFCTSQQQFPLTVANFIPVCLISRFIRLIFDESTFTICWSSSRCSFIDPLHPKINQIVCH